MLRVLQEVLCTGDKIVIVSQWTSMLKIIHSILKRKNINSTLFTGGLSIRKRTAIVNAFNHDEDSTKVIFLFTKKY